VLSEILAGKDLGSDSLYIKEQIDSLDIKLRITKNYTVTIEENLLKKVFEITQGKVELLDTLSEVDLKK
jgi:hypothetical protein